MTSMNLLRPTVMIVALVSGCRPSAAHSEAFLVAREAAATRDDNRRKVHTFFERLEAKDIDGFVALWAEDGAQIMPFAPEGFPKRLDGVAAIRRQYADLPKHFRSMKFRDLEIRDLTDPHEFFVTYHGDIELAAGGHYDNVYAGHFRVENGKIRVFYEYFDPNVLERAFGAKLGRSFNVRL